MARRVIIIGGTAAGLSAASKLRRLEPQTEIVVYEMSGYIGYGACGLPYFIGGVIDDIEDLLSFTPETIKAKRQIDVHVHHQVVDVNLEDKSVLVRNLKSGEELRNTFDDLVFATGAVAVMPPIPGLDNQGIYQLKNVEDGLALRDAAKAGDTAIIMGGGLIGLEVAEALVERGMKVEIVEMLPRLMPFFEERYSGLIMQELEKHDVRVHLNTAITSVQSCNGRFYSATLSTGERLQGDLLLVSAGVKPRTELAAKAGVKLGLRGGIVVDEQMRTSIPHVYACGDCVEMKHILSGEPVYIPLGTTANKQGRVCGSTLGGEEASFTGVLGSQATKVFDLFLAATGYNLKQAQEKGFDAVSSTIQKSDLAGYYPGTRPQDVTLIFDRQTGRLLGGQGIR